jgi:3-oxoacyl-[acyl-carrier-protein] synthase II
MRRVVVTGIGAVTPLGNTFRESWKNLLEGMSGISRIEGFDVSDLAWTYAGQIRGLSFESFLTNKERRRYDLFVQYAAIAARQAVDDAGLNDASGDDVSVIVGSSRAGVSSLDRAVRQQHDSGKKISPYLMPSTTTSMAASFIAQKFGYRGECEGISSACASGTVAIGNAYRLIRTGLSDIVVAGGTEAPICRVCIEGYGNAGALSKREGDHISSPFDKARDGFVLSEGACILIFEEYESARKRGVTIYGEVIGYAGGMDAYHQTRPSSMGEVKTILKALGDAMVSTHSVGFISAHAPSTLLGDRAEAEALRSVFGTQTSAIAVSSFKSCTGHMLAASGAFEAASSLMVLKEGIIPPTINLKDKDPACNLNIVTAKQKTDADCAMVNSFGFGGVNAVLVVKKIS